MTGGARGGARPGLNRPRSGNVPRGAPRSCWSWCYLGPSLSPAPPPHTSAPHFHTFPSRPATSHFTSCPPPRSPPISHLPFPFTLPLASHLDPLRQPYVSRSVRLFILTSFFSCSSFLARSRLFHLSFFSQTGSWCSGGRRDPPPPPSLGHVITT